MTAARRASEQNVLPLDWSAGGANDAPLCVGRSNAEAVHFLTHVGEWAMPCAILVGPPRSGRSLMARRFAQSTGGTVIDGPASVSEDAMFHAWNAARASGVPLLILADAAPGEWGIALPDLASRLASTPVVRIGAPDDCLARDLIDTLFAQRGIALAPDVARYIVPRMERSYAMIHRIVTALDHAALAQGRRIGIRLARDVLLAQGLIDPDLVDRSTADGGELDRE